MHEGKPQRQAIAIAFSVAKRKRGAPPGNHNAKGK